MTHKDRAGDPSGHRAGRREAAGPAGHREGFPTPSGGSPARSLWVIINDLWYKARVRSVPIGSIAQPRPRRPVSTDKLAASAPRAIFIVATPADHLRRQCPKTFHMSRRTNNTS